MADTIDRDQMRHAIEREACELEKTRDSCSRCVLMLLQKHLEMGGTNVARASAPLAGSIVLSGESCGALLGGLVAVGLAVADEDLENKQAFLTTVTAGFHFLRHFQKEFRASACRELQTARLGGLYSVAKPDKHVTFVKTGGYAVSSALVGKANCLAAEFILELPDRGAARIPPVP